MTDSSSSPDTGDSQDGTDTPTTEWFGQSVDSDAELADELVAEHGEDEAEQLFDEQAQGEDVEARRRGDHIDPELGQAAYHEQQPDHAADDESA